MTSLIDQHCTPLQKGTPALSAEEIAMLRKQLHPEWMVDEDQQQIHRDCRFENFHETMAFVNAVAWVAHRQEHHPDMEVGYKHCLVRYSTHAIGGLSQNDFICAARIDALLC